MYALSIRQPFAALAVLGIKGVENRSKAMPRKFEGTTVLIHAGLELYPGFKRGDWWDEALSAAYGMDKERIHQNHVAIIFAERLLTKKDGMPMRGGIIGAVRFGTSVQDSSSPWAMPDSWHWIIEDTWPLPFFPCRGQLGPFKINYPYSTEKPQCLEALAGTAGTV